MKSSDKSPLAPQLVIAASFADSMSVQAPEMVRPDTVTLPELPSEILVNIFSKLDLGTFTRCLVLCKSINEVLTETPSLVLHHELQANHMLLHPQALQANPHIPAHQPPNTAQLLSTFRERLTRFRNMQPWGERVVELKEPDGNLYEFIEGVLLRSIGSSRTADITGLAIYDMRQGVGWEDDDGQETATFASGSGSDGGNDVDEVIDAREGIDDDQVERREYRPTFAIKEVAVDPGQDLLVVTEVETREERTHIMKFHLLSLTTLERHPLASSDYIQWPVPLARKSIQLEFQICDDGFYVLKKGGHQDESEQICGWQWTTGRLAVVVKPPPSSSFEALILLTPSSFIVPTVMTHVAGNFDLAAPVGDVDIDSILSWTHHLRLYAFPPLLGHTPDPDSREPHDPPHTAIHVATVDLPKFFTALNQNIPPPRLTLRCDPPPRQTFPTHPSTASSGPPAFVPDPSTGIFVLEFYCQDPDPGEEDPHYTMIFLKETLLKLLPPSDSPLLTLAFSRPAPVIAWETIAPDVRLFEDIRPQSWVCYVYHHRFVTFGPFVDVDSNREGVCVTLYDFDPLRVREEISSRQIEIASHKELLESIGEITTIKPPMPKMEGFGEDGVSLTREKTEIVSSMPLEGHPQTGERLPFLMSERCSFGDLAAVLIDQERIITVQDRARLSRSRKAGMTIQLF